MQSSQKGISVARQMWLESQLILALRMLALSDFELEAALGNCISFMRLVDLSIDDVIPDSTASCQFWN